MTWSLLPARVCPFQIETSGQERVVLVNQPVRRWLVRLEEVQSRSLAIFEFFLYVCMSASLVTGERKESSRLLNSHLWHLHPKSRVSHNLVTGQEHKEVLLLRNVTGDQVGPWDFSQVIQRLCSLSQVSLCGYHTSATLRLWFSKLQLPVPLCYLINSVVLSKCAILVGFKSNCQNDGRKRL